MTNFTFHHWKWMNLWACISKFPPRQSIQDKHLEIYTQKYHTVPKQSSVMGGGGAHIQTIKNKGSPPLHFWPKDELCSLATVDDYILRHDSSLQHAHLGVVAAATEEPRRFYLEVGDPLSVVIHNTKAIFFQYFVILLFDFLEDSQKVLKGDSIYCSLLTHFLALVWEQVQVEKSLKITKKQILIKENLWNFSFLFHWMACGILFPDQGSNLGTLQ